MDQDELRDYPRFPLDAEARISNFEGTSLSTARTLDVSKGGVHVISDIPVALDEVYTLAFAVPHEGGRSNVFALMDVVYCARADDGSAYEIGFAFRQVGVSHATLILAYINQRQHPLDCMPHGRCLPLPAYLRGIGPVAMPHA